MLNLPKPYKTTVLEYAKKEKIKLLIYSKDKFNGFVGYIECPDFVISGIPYSKKSESEEYISKVYYFMYVLSFKNRERSENKYKIEKSIIDIENFLKSNTSFETFSVPYLRPFKIRNKKTNESDLNPYYHYKLGVNVVESYFIKNRIIRKQVPITQKLPRLSLDFLCLVQPFNDETLVDDYLMNFSSYSFIGYLSLLTNDTNKINEILDSIFIKETK